MEKNKFIVKKVLENRHNKQQYVIIDKKANIDTGSYVLIKVVEE